MTSLIRPLLASVLLLLAAGARLKKGSTMRYLALAFLMLFAAGSASAQFSDDWRWMTPRCAAKNKPTSNPALGASLLYVPGTNTEGCYASGSTSLATNGAAMTFARNATAYYVNTSGWASCPANQARLTGEGILLDAPGTNLLATPTDAPTSSGNWALIAAGPTVTTGRAFVDGTATATTFTESAGVVSGLQQSVTVSTKVYAMSAIFTYVNRACWGFSLDGTTVHAKFDLSNGTVAYTAPGAWAGAQNIGGGWFRFWAQASLTAGTVTPQLFATAACTDNTKAATGGTSVTYLSRVQFETNVGATVVPQPTSYTPTGTARPADTISFPFTAAPTNDLCISWKMHPYVSPLGARGGGGGIMTAGDTLGGSLSAPNTLTVYASGNTVYFNTYDSGGALRGVSIVLTDGPNTRPRVVKACTSSTGTVTLSVNGSRTSTSTGVGSGVLSVLPTKVSFGSIGGAGQYASSMIVSDVAVCPTSDPDQCGDYAIGESGFAVAYGDSLSTVGSPAWPAAAATLSGFRILNLAKGGWRSSDVWANYQVNRWHRPKYVAVWVGTNDTDPSAAWDNIKSTYEMIIQDGGIPIPMTVPPRTGTCRTDLNNAIKSWSTRNGYPYVDAAAILDAGTCHLKAEYDSGDDLHENTAGAAAVAAAVAPLLK